MKGRSGELVEMLKGNYVDVCSVQEVRQRGASDSSCVRDRDSNFSGSVGINILLEEKWVDKVIEIVGVCDKIIKSLIGKLAITFISAYIPQSGLTDEHKD